MMGVFKEWLRGPGLPQKTWRTIIEVLRWSDLHTLADELEAALQ